MNRAKKIGVTLALACFLTCGFGFSFFGSVKNVKAEEQKTIDVYVIAGQSNAAGCATISSVDNSRKKSQYTNGFENIYFYGKVDANESLNSNGPFNTFDKVVKFGQGFDDDRFGAEIGIADAIAKSGTKNESIIVKYASGSLDITNHWCPPSKRGESSTKGAWYDGCMKTVQTVVTHYKALNYTVNLKGTFWMQGEAESENGNASLYEGYLTALVDDMRNDYAETFGETATSAPFVVGKVAPTYNYPAATGVETVRAAQDNVAKKLKNVYTAETDRYTIVDKTTGNFVAGCVDKWHFNGNDMIALGIQVGNRILYPTEEKTIAMYLIAGQSNASGYSLVSQIDQTYKDEHSDGFENVIMYGRADGRQWNTFDQKVTFGCGIGTDRFGAEVGIAEKHMAAYPDQEAIIVKYAQGSTYLVDTVNSVTNEHGNWCPPSMTYSQGELSGKLYRGLLDTIEKAVDYYYDCGYTIDLKGTFWMQGEAEADGSYSKGNYQACLSALIDDLRKDCATILDDETAKSAPFVIGKICPSFHVYGNSGAAAVRKIQDAVAAEKDMVYLVETEDYIMVNPDGTWRGPDKWHFEGNDMISLGQNVGETFITSAKAFVRVQVKGHGKADYSSEYVFLNKTDPKTIKFSATKDHYVIKSVLYDGEDVLSELVDGAFTITDTEGAHKLVVTFEKEPKYSITLDADENTVNVVRNPISKGYYVGEKVTIEISAKTGYKIDDVTFNGNAISANGGQYEVTITDGENKLIVNAVTDGTNVEPNIPDDSGNGDSSSIDNKEETSGCASSIGATSCIFAILLGVAFAVVKRRKRI